MVKPFRLAAFVSVVVLAACGGGGGGGDGSSPPLSGGGGGSTPEIPRDQLGIATQAEVGGGMYLCMNKLIGREISTDHSVRVAPNATCRIEGTVGGNVQVQRGSKLHTEGATIGGTIESVESQASSIYVSRTAIEGNVQFKDSLLATVVGSTIKGNVQLNSNSGAQTVQNNVITSGNIEVEQNTGDINLFANDVRNGSILVNQNRSASGTSPRINDNKSNGKLECQANTPAPIGGGNAPRGGVGGDQCNGLII